MTVIGSPNSCNMGLMVMFSSAMMSAMMSTLAHVDTVPPTSIPGTSHTAIATAMKMPITRSTKFMAFTYFLLSFL